MLKRLRLMIPILLTLVLIPQALAQTCPAIVQTALDAAGELCAAAGRNQACYGHVALTAEAQPNVADFQFEQVGQIEDVIDIQSLKLQGMDETTGMWGVVLMRLQANIPNTLPGQNVTFLLFGDVEMTSAVTDDDYTPMQAFILRTGFTETQCEETPESGLLVQTPAGVGQVAFNVNGVDVSMGSTVFFQAQAGDSLKVRTLEGAATLEVDDEIIPVVAGTESEVPMNEDLQPDGAPSKPQAYDQDDVEWLPLEPLEREIEITPPLDDEVIARIERLLEANLPVCGIDPLPSCDELPEDAGGVGCVMVADDTLRGDPDANYCGDDDYARFAREEEDRAALENERPVDEQPPADQPPADEPPRDEPPPADEPPVDEPPPADQPPADEPPRDEPPPADPPPADEPPPADQPPADQPPGDEPPRDEEGADE